jgi:hypothetical protein
MLTTSIVTLEAYGDPDLDRMCRALLRHVNYGVLETEEIPITWWAQVLTTRDLIELVAYAGYNPTLSCRILVEVSLRAAERDVATLPEEWRRTPSDAVFTTRGFLRGTTSVFTFMDALWELYNNVDDVPEDINARYWRALYAMRVVRAYTEFAADTADERRKAVFYHTLHVWYRADYDTAEANAFRADLLKIAVEI